MELRFGEFWAKYLRFQTNMLEISSKKFENFGANIWEIEPNLFSDFELNVWDLEQNILDFELILF